MSEIVERLRKGDVYGDCKHDRCMCDVMDEAADEITRLRAALEEVRALVFGANHSETRYPLARAALGGKDE